MLVSTDRYCHNALYLYFFLPWLNSPQWARVSSLSRIHDHTQTLQWVGLLWTSDRPVAKTSTWQHTTFTTDIQTSGRIRTRNLSKLAAADPRRRPRGHWDGRTNNQ